MSSFSAHQSKPIFYRAELDTLRFFAFLAVFLHHVIPNNRAYFSEHGLGRFISVTLAGAASAGAFGVDLFFLLSAFLITELLIREREHTGELNVRAFYARRILRIWPLYFLIIVIASLITFFDTHESFDWRYKLGFLLLSGNWVCSAVGYPHSIAAPLWSVSIEEQFYLLWPNAVKRSRKNTILTVAVTLIVVAWIARALVLYGNAAHPALWCNTLCRLDPIAFGIILAVVLRRFSFEAPLIYRLLSIASGVVILVSAAIFGCIDNTSLPVAPNLIAYPAAALGCLAIFLGVYNVKGAASRVASHRALTYLGKISYGLYAFHVLCIRLATRWLGGHSLSAAGARSMLSIALTVALASFSYRFFEAPFLRLKNRFAVITSRVV